MEHFESTPNTTPEASPADVHALRSQLAEQGYQHYDDHEAVINEAVALFSNYPETDVVAIVTELYREDQAAAQETDDRAS